MYNLLIIKIICAISPYAWYSCHAHMYLLAYITIRVDIASIPNFINYKKHHLARNETLIWNFIGSLWFLLIVVHRYVVNSGLMSVMKEEPLHIQSIFLYLFGMWGKTGINCFVMITGYFMCKSHISLRKFMKLLFEIYFYNLIITGTFLLTGYCSPSFSTVFYALVPIQSFGVNFVACFVVFYLLIPFLNLLIQTMNSKLHLRLILLCLLVYSVIGTIPKE